MWFQKKKKIMNQQESGTRKCVHGWDFNEKGQCPKCARNALAAINWSLVKAEDIPSLKDIIKTATDQKDKS